MRLLGYAAAHPNHELVFRPSDMELKFHCDGSHNSQKGAKGIAGGYFYLGDKHNPMALNGAIHIMCKTIPVVTASAGETEYATLFMAGQEASMLRSTLESLGHVQPPLYCGVYYLLNMWSHIPTLLPCSFIPGDIPLVRLQLLLAFRHLHIALTLPSYPPPPAPDFIPILDLDSLLVHTPPRDPFYMYACESWHRLLPLFRPPPPPRAGIG